MGRPSAGELGGLSFADSLVRLSHLVQYVFADVSREYGLTTQQTQLICRLLDAPLGMTELGAALHLEKSSITGMIDRIEKRGLVSRVPHPNDRRAFRVTLTDEGTRIAYAAHDALTASVEELAGGLTPTKRKTVVSVIEALLAAHTASTGAHWGVPVTTDSRGLAAAGS